MTQTVKFNACLFDLDGTLLDTAPDFTFCMNQLLQQYGYPLVTEAHFRSVISHGAFAMVQYCFAFEKKQSVLKKITEEFLALYQEVLGQHSRFFPGIESLLSLLNEKKIAWGIVTNKPTRYTLPLVKQFPLLEGARCLVAGDTLPQKKPHAEPIFLALKQINANPKATLFVGDAHTDVLASQAAGLKCIVANYGYISTQENVVLWNSDYYVSCATEIKQYFM